MSFTFGTITLFIFLAQFLVTTKIFGRDQFFCLNFGRDQKLGEENEKGYDHKQNAKSLFTFVSDTACSFKW